MSLPKLMYPKFEIEMPSTGKKLSIRPFLVKEEKILLLAQQSGNTRDIINAIVQVITNCVVDPDFDPKDLTTFDMEYMFIKLRAHSINNLIEITYRDPDDNIKYPIDIDLNDVVLKTDPRHNKKIKINDDLTLIMKYPKPNMIPEGETMTNELEVFFSILKHCMECVYTKDEVFNFADYSEKDIDEFVQTLDVKTYTKIQEFFETVPKLYYEIVYKDKEGNDKLAVLNSLDDFFMLG